jgi:hypothetical protein
LAAAHQKCEYEECAELPHFTVSAPTMFGCTVQTKTYPPAASGGMS